MIHHNPQRMGLAACALALTFSGCRGGVPLAPAPAARLVPVAILATDDLNPDREGRPSPVILQIFVLRDAGAFSSASFEALSTDAATVLADGVLAEERQIVRPGQQTLLSIKVDPDAAHLGVVAQYSGVLGAQWRAVMTAPSKQLLDFMSAQPVSIQLGRDAVRLAAGSPHATAQKGDTP